MKMVVFFIYFGVWFMLYTWMQLFGVMTGIRTLFKAGKERQGEKAFLNFLSFLAAQPCGGNPACGSLIVLLFASHHTTPPSTRESIKKKKKKKWSSLLCVFNYILWYYSVRPCELRPPKPFFALQIAQPKSKKKFITRGGFEGKKKKKLFSPLP